VSAFGFVWDVSNYVAVREYLGSPDAKRRRRQQEATVERKIRRAKGLPGRMRALARELNDDPRFLPLLPPIARVDPAPALLWKATIDNLRALAGQIERQFPPPSLRDYALPLPRRSNYTTIADDMRRHVKQVTGKPADRAIEAILYAACEEVGIDWPKPDSIRRHSYRRR
jgi:hypothetical protein